MKKTIALIAVFTVFLMLSVNVVAAPKLGKITFIHYKKGYAKPGAECGNGICEPGENANRCPADCGGGTTASSCYGFIAKGFKWKWIEPYLINPTNSDGLSASFVKSAVDAGVAEWEKYGGDIFGSSSIDYSATYDGDSTYDGRNEIVFGTENPGIIAVTSIWGVWWGKPDQRYIVEYDIKFNDYYAWGNATINPSLMDLQNIATHELGHGAGMDDLYETACIDETMYGYSDNGETSKRDLNTGDITGIKELY